MPGALRGSYRIARLFLYLCYGIWLTLRHGSGAKGPERMIPIRRRWYRRILELAGVEVHCRGEGLEGPVLVVANHVSWLDIPVLGAALDVWFLSKSEVARWPLIGWLARRNGTLFIRRGAHEADAAAQGIMGLLRQGQQVLLFPEGTTTRGDTVLRFHPRLFAAALETGFPVQPVALYYPPETKGSPAAATYSEGDTLLPRAWTLLCSPRTPVKLHLLPALPVDGLGRRQLAEAAHRAVVEALGLPAEPGRRGARNPAQKSVVPEA